MRLYHCRLRDEPPSGEAMPFWVLFVALVMLMFTAGLALSLLVALGGCW